MSLRDLKIKLSYNSGVDDLVNEFYIPNLREAIHYERAAGFFTSGSLILISQGINELIKNSGTMRLICSPKLTEEDIEAINRGYEERSNILQDAILREINGIPDKIVNSTLNCLTWLIANNKLDIKIAVPNELRVDNYGIYHEKLGLFHDRENNTIAFYGSHNETMSGIWYNYESFDVYKSWIDEERCRLKKVHFKELWENNSKGLEIRAFPQAAKERIIEKVMPQDNVHELDLMRPIFIKPKRDKDIFLEGLWYFQKEAISAWENKNYVGMFSMATGTGKTKTAIGGIISLIRKHKQLFAIIACPQNTIVKQWENDIGSIDLFESTLIADATNPAWRNELANRVLDYNDKQIKTCVVFTTYNTLASNQFVKIATGISDNSLLVCDEVHWAGADTFGKGLLPLYKSRLGLSATPARHMDPEGTDDLLAYFKDVVYEFSLERALKEINPDTGKTFLCPYNYQPIFVELGSEELVEYADLCRQIAAQYAKEKKSSKRSEYFQRLCEKRQMIIVNARSKHQALDELLESMKEVVYTLVYCSPQQIDTVQSQLNSKGIINHKFTGYEGTHPLKEYNLKSEREYILDNFENGNYSALVAMKCLDEGINVLRAENGIFMASSTNPKQYIQRRGRLLRRHNNKNMAKIYDLIVLPYLDERRSKTVDPDERKILSKELERYEEFSYLADNKIEAMNKIFKIKELYDFRW